MSTPTYLPVLATDFATLRQECIDQLKAKFPTWSDLQDSNNMIALVELFAGLQEQTIVYANRQARECFLQYAQDPANVEAHARGRGYTPQYQTPSQVSCMINLSKALSGSTSMPAGFKFATKDSNIFYEVKDAVTLPPGVTTYGPVVLYQQETWQINATGTGQASQTVDLLKTPVRPSTVKLYIDGVLWTPVTHFVDSVSTSPHYMVLVDSTGHAQIKFGDGVNGKAPAQSVAITGSYQTCFGSKGAVAPDYMSTGTVGLVDSISGQTVTLSAYNAVAALPGSDKETVEQIRVRASNFMRTPQSCLGVPEVEAAVMTLPGVEAVKAVNWLTSSALPHHVLQVFVAPKGAAKYSTILDQVLIAAVEELLTVTKPVLMGIVPQVAVPIYVPLDYQFTLTAKPGYALTEVENAVATKLQELFDPEIKNIWGFKPAFGQSIYQSQVIMILQQVPGVLGLDMAEPGNVLLKTHEYPQLSHVTINGRVIINPLTLG